MLNFWPYFSLISMDNDFAFGELKKLHEALFLNLNL